MSLPTAVLAVLGLLVVAPLLIAIGSARSIVLPGRSRPWTDPRATAGLEYEDIDFEATDGVALEGWLVHARERSEAPGPAVVMGHGWIWTPLSGA